MSVLLISLPGIYPSFPAVGLEMLAFGLRARGHSTAVINGHLGMVEFLEERILLSLCQHNIWDLLYAHLVYPHARVGLRSKRVLRTLTNPMQSYRLGEDDLLKIVPAITHFNEHLIRRITSFPIPTGVGFNIQNNQLLVAKYFAGLIKDLWGNAVWTIVGGASVRDGLGESIVAHHPEFDFACEGSGVPEMDMLLQARSPSQMHGLFRRDVGGKVHRGTTDHCQGRGLKEPDLTYEEFYTLRRGYEKRYDFSVFHPWDGVPAMLASGCRWGRCRFCNLRGTHVPQSIREVVQSILRRTQAAGVSKVFLLDLCQPDSRALRRFFRVLEKTGKPYLFGAMLRCDIEQRDLERFRKNGLDICHLGIEAYSDSLLRKMHKGVRLIDIVQTVISCVEEGIHVEGNLILNLPWESAADIEETGRNLSILSHLPLPRIISYKLSHGSIAFRVTDPRRGHDWAPDSTLGFAYPPGLRDSVATMYYSRRSSRLDHEDLWLQVLEKYRGYALRPPHLVYEAFGDGLLIHDTRDLAAAKRSFFRGPIMPRLYQYCREIRSRRQISRRFSTVSASQVDGALDIFVSKSIMLHSNGHYLSIALKRK